MRIASNRVLAATAGLLAIAGVAVAAETSGGKTGSGGSPTGQPTSPDSPTMGGPADRQPGAGVREGHVPRDRRDEPTTRPTSPPGERQHDHR